MQKTYCDICGKEAPHTRKRILHRAGICGGYGACWEADICPDCEADLDWRTAKLEHEFTQEMQKAREAAKKG
ncbi:MAG: hypothetical protein NC489_37945 [Ruminococcus flavefaciens]|nr:hypothetical protein [Ruminococcus flavefaciens]